ncbi:hypothetical protein BABINDRAFT_161443 [Babjeviella inositovora NRRL Y-12698]|uniref:Uncharacterized protein n=1 Tax=Babjeviella inositovora NRRL Y-12698 TaxID=984486 RepID=A0A1E3QS20_9ASCO|nr:uncharacterized protein BABINDRAFT_161443 [Babjeviella inositovora NRRL Y-12698]ODQ79737.1 hypothetical protein BABINDRAFT_161443 [Babjeviella inositovora NRRL Y-12698]
MRFGYSEIKSISIRPSQYPSRANDYHVTGRIHIRLNRKVPMKAMTISLKTVYTSNRGAATALHNMNGGPTQDETILNLQSQCCTLPVLGAGEHNLPFKFQMPGRLGKLVASGVMSSKIKQVLTITLVKSHSMLSSNFPLVVSHILSSSTVLPLKPSSKKLLIPFHITYPHCNRSIRKCMVSLVETVSITNPSAARSLHDERVLINRRGQEVSSTHTTKRIIVQYTIDADSSNTTYISDTAITRQPLLLMVDDATDKILADHLSKVGKSGLTVTVRHKLVCLLLGATGEQMFEMPTAITESMVDQGLCDLMEQYNRSGWNDDLETIYDGEKDHSHVTEHAVDGQSETNAGLFSHHDQGLNDDNFDMATLVA